MQNGNYHESKEYLREALQFPQTVAKVNGPLQPRLLQYVVTHSHKGNPSDVINKIDQFCATNWMMNLGPEKGLIVRQKGFHKDVAKVLEIGGYCGYSGLVFANEIKDRINSKVYTVEINQNYAEIAKKIHSHAGLVEKVEIVLGTVQSTINYLKSVGPFDLIFIDHIKHAYLADFKLLQANGCIKKGTVVVGDNIIYPGAPQYLAHFKISDEYTSTLYYGYLEYSNDPDAVLISVKK